MAKKYNFGVTAVFKDGSNLAQKYLTESFILDDVSDNEALSIVSGGLLKDRLRKMDNFIRVRTVCVESIESAAGEEPLEEEAELQELMTEAVELGCKPSNLDGYDSPEATKKALKRAIKKAEEKNELEAELEAESKKRKRLGK